MQDNKLAQKTFYTFYDFLSVKNANSDTIYGKVKTIKPSLENENSADTQLK
jgi:hypothetical protein